MILNPILNAKSVLIACFDVLKYFNNIKSWNKTESLAVQFDFEIREQPTIVIMITIACYSINFICYPLFVYLLTFVYFAKITWVSKTFFFKQFPQQIESNPPTTAVITKIYLTEIVVIMSLQLNVVFTITILVLLYLSSLFGKIMEKKFF